MKKNQEDNGSGENLKERRLKWFSRAGDAKLRSVCIKKYLGKGREEGLDGWVEWGMISERRDCRGRKCMTALHGGVYHQTRTPYKSGIKMKGRRRLYWD